MSGVVACRLTTEPLLPDELAASVRDDVRGAVVVFEGNVRNHDDGRQVVALRYEIHPSTSDVLERLAAEVAERHPLTVLSVAHRYGDVPIGDAAFVVAVASSHRAAAFAAAGDAVETVKEQLPIWKHQSFADGTAEWVACA